MNDDMPTAAELRDEMRQEIKRLKVSLVQACEQRLAARRDALEEAAVQLETMHFLFTIQRPGTGPFTRQDQTMREVIEQGAAAIRGLKP